MAPIKLVIDTDPGIDDAMAILYAALCPDIDLLALTTVFGNVTVDIATRNALRLCEMAGLDIPVARGAAAPLARDPRPPSSHVHGAEGFGTVPPVTPAGQPHGGDAAELLIDLARRHAGDLVVCPIGPITNIAEALRRDPEFARNVRSIVLMGGAAFARGNVTPHAEANTHNDPHALAEVIASGAPVTMVGLDVTMQVLCTAADFAFLRALHPEYGGFLEDASRHYLDFYASIGAAGCGLHDPAAVIACHRPDLFEIRRLPIRVVETGPEIGRTLPVAPGEAPEIGVCTGGDMAAVKQLFLDAFRR